MNVVDEKTGYENLANAIVLQAFDDYVNYRVKLEDPDLEQTERELIERELASIKKWSNSETFHLYTNLDSLYLIKTAEAKAKEKLKCQKKKQPILLGADLSHHCSV